MSYFRIPAEILPNPDSFLIPITLIAGIGITEVDLKPAEVPTIDLEHIPFQSKFIVKRYVIDQIVSGLSS
jgi:hypothetical protein